MRKEENRHVEIVQLLGDIDDIVSEDDSKDLRVIQSRKFSFLRVRGTGHGDIINFGAETKIDDDLSLGQYRVKKFMFAATAEFTELEKQNEEQPYKTDDEVTHIVFVLHGIRDLGRWSAAFETRLREAFQSTGQKLAVVSSRYGYFGNGVRHNNLYN